MFRRLLAKHPWLICLSRGYHNWSCGWDLWTTKQHHPGLACVCETCGTENPNKE